MFVRRTEAMCSALFSMGWTTLILRMLELICRMICCGEYTL